MRDIEVAKSELLEQGWALVVVKDGRILARQNKPRLIPLLSTMQELGEDAEGAALADKVIGKAAACIAVYHRIANLYTPLLSREAIAILEQGDVNWQGEQIVPHILNQTGDDLCPMEKIVAGAATADQGYQELIAFFQKKGVLDVQS